MPIKGFDEFKVLLGKKREPGPKGHVGVNHFANFIDAVRKRARAIQNGRVETIRTSSGLADLGYIS